MNHKKNIGLLFMNLYPLQIGGTLLLGLINSCASFLLPVSIGEFFTIYFHSQSSKGKLLKWLGIQIYTLQDFYLLFVILLVVKMIAGYFESINNRRLGELFVKDLREQIFSAQMRWHPLLLSKSAYGKYLLRYSNDMKAVQNYFSKGILDGLKNVIFLGTGIFLLSKIHLVLSLMLVALFSIACLLIYFVSDYQKKFIIAARTHRSGLLAFVAKAFSGYEKIVVRNRDAATIDKFKNRSQLLYDANIRSVRLESLIQNMASFMIFLMIGILLWQMTLPYGQIHSSEGLMMILMILMMQGALRGILKVPGYINKGNVSLEKIRQILEQPVQQNVSILINT